MDLQDRARFQHLLLLKKRRWIGRIFFLIGWCWTVWQPNQNNYHHYYATTTAVVNAIEVETRSGSDIRSNNDDNNNNMCIVPSKIVSPQHSIATYDVNECPNQNNMLVTPPYPTEDVTRDTTITTSTLPASATHNNNNNKRSTTGSVGRNVPIGQLRPSDLPLPETFHDFTHTSSMKLPGKGENQTIHYGTIQQINPILYQSTGKNNSNNSKTIGSTDIMYLPNIMDVNDVENVLLLLRNFHHYDEDPDTVDGMTTHEIFVDSPDLQQMILKQRSEDTATATTTTKSNSDNGQQLPNTSMKVRDYDSTTIHERNHLRNQLQAILQPILKERITPLIQTQYAHLCRPHPKANRNNNNENDTDHYNDDRSCTPCYSLIRRYRYGERQSHGTHYDGHALMTVVISLSNYSTNYYGGLYVSTGYGQRQFVPLYSGDGMAHQSTLLHGVQVLPLLHDPSLTERWSWILWYRDSTTCNDYSYEWFVNCAKQGDAICQELYATKIGNAPPTSSHRNNDVTNMNSIVYWNRVSAEQGNGNAAIKMARAYLKLLPSTLIYNRTEAIRYYQLAITAQHPDGYYGLANLYLESLLDEATTATDPKRREMKLLVKVVKLLEGAAMRGHTYAMFNLGIVHCYGYGIQRVDTDLAALWFIQSGLPEGYFAAAYQAALMGNITRQQELNAIAKKLGYYEPWRKEARRRTGSGGAGGVDLNMRWPVSADGRRPPIF